MRTRAVDRNNVHIGGTGPKTLLFGHGFGTDQRAWRFVAPSFLDSHRIVTFDHVGFGGSDRTAYADTRYRTLEGYAVDLVEIVDELAEERVTYVGHSIGGVIGLLASLAAPERFERLVLVGSSPRFINDPPDYVGGFERADIEAILDAMESDQLAWSQSLAPVAMGEQSPPELVNEFGNTLSALDPLIARSFGRAVFTVDCRAAPARGPGADPGIAMHARQHRAQERRGLHAAPFAAVHAARNRCFRPLSASDASHADGSGHRQLSFFGGRLT